MKMTDFERIYALRAELVEIVKGWETIKAGAVRGRVLTPWESERLEWAKKTLETTK